MNRHTLSGKFRYLAGLLPFCAAISCVELPVPTSTEHWLPPSVSDNMVLQRGAQNCISGRNRPYDRVSVMFQGVTKSTRANREGGWSIALDIPRVARSQPEELTITSTGKQGAHVVVLTNVVVGDVWVVGLSGGQGVSLQTAAGFSSSSTRVRFITLPSLNRNQATGLAPLSGWRTCAAGSASLEQLDALAFFFAAHLANSVSIGIVQTPSDQISPNLVTDASLSKARQEFLDGPVRLGLIGAWVQATNSVAEALKARKMRVMALRDVGTIPTLPPILPYDHFPSAHLWEQIDKSRGPNCVVRFDGGIW